MSKFDDASKAFTDWFKSLEGSYLSPDVALYDFSSDGRGRGMIALRDIEAEKPLFAVPAGRVLSENTSEVSRKLVDIFKFDEIEFEYEDAGARDEDALSDDWRRMILVLMYEFFHRKTSQWGPYFDVLPESTDSLMFWSENDLDELQASPVLDRISKQEVERAFRGEILPSIKKHADVFYPADMKHLDDDELISLAHRMASTIAAYAFDVEKHAVLPQAKDLDLEGSNNGSSMVPDLEDSYIGSVMVPMADMLNADAEHNARMEEGSLSDWILDETNKRNMSPNSSEDNDLVMVSTRAIKAGEEILNTYDSLSNAELLRKYGYTSPNYQRYTDVDIWWDLIEEAAAEELTEDKLYDSEAKAKVEARLSHDERPDTFDLASDGMEPGPDGRIEHEESFADRFDFPEDLYECIGAVLLPAASKELRDLVLLDEDGTEDLPQTASREYFQLLHRVMHRAVSLRLKQYPTTIPEDEKLLESSKPGSRLYRAIEVRLGEKRLLRDIIDFTANELAALDAGNDEVESDAKRRRKRRFEQAFRPYSSLDLHSSSASEDNSSDADDGDAEES